MKNLKGILSIVFVVIISVSIVEAGFLMDKYNSPKRLKENVGKIYRLKDVTKYGYVDRTGKWIIPPKFVYIGSFDDEGYAVATKVGRITISERNQFAKVFGNFVKDAKFGFVNVRGDWIIKPKYDVLHPFSEGLAKAKIDKKKGFIDRAGFWYDTKEAFYSKHPELRPKDLPLPDFSSLQHTLVFEKYNNLWGIKNHANNIWVVKPQFLDKKTDFEKDGLAVVKSRNNKYGMIDKSGRWAVKPEFVDIDFLGDNGLRAAKKDGKYGYIDSNGKFIIPPKYDDAHGFSGGYAEISIDKQCGFINGHGSIVIEPKYEECSSEKGKFIVKLNGKYGLLDHNNRWILKPLFKKIDIVDEYMIKVEYGNYEGYTDANGKPLTFTMDEVKNIVNSQISKP